MPRTFWIIFAVGLLLRIAAIELRPANALSRAPDEGEYLSLARHLAHGDGFTLTGAPTAYRDLLFPFAAALVLRVCGDSPTPVLYGQVALSLLSALLLYTLGRRRFSERAAFVMAAIWLLYPGAILFSALFLTETLFLFLWIAALVLFDRLEASQNKLTPAVLVGITLGLLLLTRAAGVVLVGAMVLSLLLRRKPRWTALAVLLAATFITVLPWMARNAKTIGAFTLNTNGGINLLIGSNPYAQGAYNFSEEVQALLPPESAGEVARDHAGTAYALSYARALPARTLKLCARKLAYLWSTDMSFWLHYAPGAGSDSLSAHLRSLPLIALLITALPYLLLVLAGVAGLVLVTGFPARDLYLWQLGLGLGITLLSYGLARYHLPYMPALVVGAGALIDKSQAWPHTSLSRRLFLLLLVCGLGGVWLMESLTIAGI
jgi:4-amino-4-deoxy-L-arabinose transferase-like glycosyltransferase